MTQISLHSGITFNDQNKFQIKVASGQVILGFELVGVAQISSGCFMPINGETINGTTWASLQDEIVSKLDATTYGAPWSLSYNNVTNKWTLQSSEPIAITLNEMASFILGMENDTALTTTRTSTKEPGFIWRSESNLPFGESRVFWDSPRKTSVVTEDGFVKSFTAVSSVLRETFNIVHEPKFNILNHFSQSNRPWTYQRHIDWVGAWRPYQYYYSDDVTLTLNEREATYKNTDEGSTFGPTHIFTSGLSDEYYDLEFDAHLLSAPTEEEQALTEVTITDPAEISGWEHSWIADLDLMTTGASNQISLFQASGSSNQVGTLDANNNYYVANSSNFNAMPTILCEQTGSDGTGSLGTGGFDFGATEGFSFLYVGRMKRFNYLDITRDPGGTEPYFWSIRDDTNNTERQIFLKQSYLYGRAKFGWEEWDNSNKTGLSNGDSADSAVSFKTNPFCLVGTMGFSSGSNIRLYSNGELSANSTTATEQVTGSLSGSFDFCINAQASNFPALSPGTCQEFAHIAFFNRELTGAEARALWIWAQDKWDIE